MRSASACSRFSCRNAYHFSLAFGSATAFSYAREPRHETIGLGASHTPTLNPEKGDFPVMPWARISASAAIWNVGESLIASSVHHAVFTPSSRARSTSVRVRSAASGVVGAGNATIASLLAERQMDSWRSSSSSHEGNGLSLCGVSDRFSRVDLGRKACAVQAYHHEVVAVV
eukprot:6079068-Prymnesium_polylepis.2